MNSRAIDSIRISVGDVVFRGWQSAAQTTENLEVIVAFHGYGRPPDDFDLFLPLLKPHQMLVSLGLFAHGTSTLPTDHGENAPISASAFKTWMEGLIDALEVEHVHLLTYSMGGRIALKTAELLPHRINSMLLTAPDGFRAPWMYHPMFGTGLGRWFYSLTEKYPKWVFSLAGILRKLHLIHPKTEKFIEVHFGTKEKRRQLREVWTKYRNINPDLKRLASLVNTRQIHMQLIFGASDSVIPEKLGRRFQKRVSPNIMHTIPGGHQLLTPALITYIRENNLWF